MLLKTSLLTLGACTLLASLSHAQIIPLTNASFEATTVANGNFAGATPTGWTFAGTGGIANLAATVNPGPSDGRGYGDAPVGVDGNNYAQLFVVGDGGTNSLSQDAGVTFVAGVTYELTIAFGTGEPNSQTLATGASFSICMGTVGTNTVLQQGFVGTGTYGQFADQTIDYTATGSEVGNLIVVLATTGGSGNHYFDFDNVRLTQAVPEPSSLALAAMSGVGLLGFARRRRA